MSTTANRNSMIQLHSGVPGSESIQTEPTNCHQFLSAEGCQAAKSNGRIRAVYENTCVSKAKVVERHPWLH